MSKHCSFMFLASLILAHMAHAGDPSITSDFIFPPNVTAVNATFFTHTGLRGLIDATPPMAFKVTKASLVEFPALNGQSVSYALLQYPAGSINPPHTHPRSAELLYLLYGVLEVGLIDTTNKLYTQKLEKGDLFVFPQGLVHFQLNTNSLRTAVALSAFSSANAGTVSIPSTIFATGIEDDVLVKSFKTDVATIKKVKAGLIPKS